MYLNINSEILEKDKASLSVQNRGFKYGDALFDTLKSYHTHIFFLEDHYFRLMSSMRMLRMEIPPEFTLEYYAEQIIKTITSNKIDDYARIRVSIFRKNGGLFTPVTHEIGFIIEAESLKTTEKADYVIELYKDFPVISGQLSNIKTNNRMLNVIAGIFAKENGYDNCILLNEKKNVAEAVNANLFLIKENKIITPPLSDGCIDGIIRKNVIRYLKKSQKYKITVKSVLPIELLQADEVFLTNSITGIQCVNRYRKKKYDTTIGKELKDILERSENV